METKLQAGEKEDSGKEDSGKDAASNDVDTGGNKRCPKCRRIYPEDYDFCPEDAERLVAGLAEPEGPSTSGGSISAKSAQTKSIPTKSMLALGAVLIGVGGIVIVATRPSQAPAGTAQAGAAATAAPTPSAPGSATGTVSGQSNGAFTAKNGVSTEKAAAGTNADAGDGTAGQWRHYENRPLGFSLDYPATWTADAPKSDGTSVLVLFRSPDPHVILLVDVDAPAGGSAPIARWQQFDQRFARAYKDRYRLLALRSAQLGGSPAAQWLFTVQKKGEPDLEKVDVGATYEGRDYALLGSARTPDFPRWQGTFEHAADSFAWTHE